MLNPTLFTALGGYKVHPLDIIAADASEACFSPSVPNEVKHVWEEHGGQVAHSTAAEKTAAAFYFCAGLNDPWLPTLSSRGVVVFWSAWVLHCAAAGTQLSLRAYVLDDLFNPDLYGVEVAYDASSVTCYSPCIPPASESLLTQAFEREPLSEELDESRVESMLTTIPNSGHESVYSDAGTHDMKSEVCDFPAGDWLTGNRIVPPWAFVRSLSEILEENKVSIVSVADVLGCRGEAEAVSFVPGKKYAGHAFSCEEKHLWS